MQFEAITLHLHLCRNKVMLTLKFVVYNQNFLKHPNHLVKYKSICFHYAKLMTFDE